jgi:hypothetical protein
MKIKCGCGAEAIVFCSDPINFSFCEIHCENCRRTEKAITQENCIEKWRQRMKEYICVETLKQQDFQDYSNTDVAYAIDSCPREDVEKVTRCGDCAFSANHMERCCLCTKSEKYMKVTDFCSYGVPSKEHKYQLCDFIRKCHDEWLKKQYDFETDETLAQWLSAYLVDNYYIIKK